MKIRSFLLSAFAITTSLHAQDDLIKKISANKSDTVGFRFTTVVSAETTPVQDQGSSGTCWSYSTGSFLESEMIKHGGPSIHLSKIYAARKVYEEKAVNYLRMHGSLNYGDGGLGHDAVNMYGKYGAMPEEAYTGLNFGNDENEFAEMQAVLKGMLDALVKAPNDGKLTPVWRNAFNGVLDAYLGEVPEEFTYNGKTYTPKSFADNVVKLKADDYVEFISGTDAPYYTKHHLDGAGQLGPATGIQRAGGGPHRHHRQRLARRLHRGLGRRCQRTHLQLEERRGLYHHGRCREAHQGRTPGALQEPATRTGDHRRDAPEMHLTTTERRTITACNSPVSRRTRTVLNGTW
jgi:aminopeptidase C